MKRSTKQRDAIRNVFLEEGRPLSTTEIHEMARKNIPTMGVATVYRAVKEFLAEGWLVSMSVAGTTRYELADIGHHHHFHCEGCDRTFDIEGCVGNLAELVPKAFQVLSHELTIMGICDSCHGGSA